ncbi:transglycosylase family protein [Ornithinimicrobium sediminis]|uniref:transglycosylase family protein n=1 Tax=Ornithinimicrobium sediminis TaxID=2904603 RepID=UPI0022B82241|nr:transglycosylase family protein [Ornithinimicrobium sediminis]
MVSDASPRASHTSGTTALRRMTTVTAAGATAVGAFTMAAPAAQAQYDETVWDGVADCESSGRWDINTGNGYYGGLQFYQPTWRGYGGQTFAAFAHQATKAQQIAIARRVLHGQGPGAWPVCSVRAGLTRTNGGADPNAQPVTNPVAPGTASGVTVTRYVSATDSANIRSGPGTGYSVIGQAARGTQVTGTLVGGGWLQIGTGKFLGPGVLSTTPVTGGSAPAPAPAPGTVTRYVSASDSANVRSGPGMGYAVVGQAERGAEVTGTLVAGGWLQMASGRFLGPTVISTTPVTGGSSTPAPPASGEVTRYVSASTAAYVRSGPGSGYGVVGTVARGTTVTGTWVNGWLKIGDGRYIGPSVLSSTPIGGSTAPSTPPPSSGEVTRYVSASSAAYVRSGPGTGYRVVGTETRGTAVTGTWVNGWLKIGDGRYIGSSVLSSTPV